MARTDLFDRRNQRSVPVVLFILAALLVVARVGCKARTEHAGALVKWVSAEEGLRLAKATGKPILFDFTAEWCGPCHRLDAEVFRDAEMANEINQRFVPVRVTDRKREDGKNSAIVDELQARYSVEAFPTVVIADANGTARETMRGFRGRGAFRRMLERVR